MQEVFENIIEKLENEQKNAESFWNKFDDEDSFGAMNAYTNAIEIVKQAAEEYNNGWIICSEDEPKESGTYNVTAYDGHKLITTTAKWQPRLKSWNLTGARAYWKIIAWQPLPDPYRPKGE